MGVKDTIDWQMTPILSSPKRLSYGDNVHDFGSYHFNRIKMEAHLFCAKTSWLVILVKYLASHFAL